ncbi:unnamed protein product, partial [Effrenium voratum]
MAASKSDIPKIRAFQRNGRWYAEDNRRLWAFKEAGDVAKDEVLAARSGRGCEAKAAPAPSLPRLAPARSVDCAADPRRRSARSSRPCDAMLALLFFAVTRPALAWTRLTVVHSEKCEESGCQVAAKCPEKTWPVACESEPRGHAWFNQGSCTASARLDIEIRAKVACTSMFETFTVSGPTARCPAGSQLQRCFCQACLGAAQPLQEGPACSVRAAPQAEEDPARLAQALCLRGDSHWLLQNSKSLGFVKYCGWVPYLRPMNTPELDYRNSPGRLAEQRAAGRLDAVTFEQQMQRVTDAVKHFMQEMSEHQRADAARYLRR